MNSGQIGNESKILVKGRALPFGPVQILLEFMEPVLNEGRLGQGSHQALFDIPFAHGRYAGRKEIGDLVHLQLEQRLVAAQQILFRNPRAVSLKSLDARRHMFFRKLQ